MSVGPPEDYHEYDVRPDDVAMPTRPSERGAWRHHRVEDEIDEADDQLARRPGISRSENDAFRHHHKH